MKSLIPYLLAALVAAYTIFSRSCCDSRHRIEAALSEGVRTQLDDAGFNQVNFEANHYDLQLEGKLANEDQRADVLRIVANYLPGGRVIDNLTLSAVATEEAGAVAEAQEATEAEALAAQQELEAQKLAADAAEQERLAALALEAEKAAALQEAQRLEEERLAAIAAQRSSMLLNP